MDRLRDPVFLASLVLGLLGGGTGIVQSQDAGLRQQQLVSLGPSLQSCQTAWASCQGKLFECHEESP